MFIMIVSPTVARDSLERVGLSTLNWILKQIDKDVENVPTAVNVGNVLYSSIQQTNT